MSEARRLRREQVRFLLKFARRMAACFDCEEHWNGCPSTSYCSEYWLRTLRKKG